MTRFLVETYAPRSQANCTAAGRVRAADQLAREGRPSGTCARLLPDVETCFHVFESQSAEAVAEVAQRAGFEDARVVRVVE
jgi:hypothetical protein